MKPPEKREWIWRRATGSRLTLAVVSSVAGVFAVPLLTLGGGPKEATSTSATSAGQTRAPRAPLPATVAPQAELDGETDEDPGAVAFFQERDGADKVVDHVDKVRWSGRYLRVYTDLAEHDTRSKVALDLCKWTSEYLTDRRGAQNPVVFVHAKKTGNGNVVLVSKLSAEQACKSVETR